MRKNLFTLGVVAIVAILATSAFAANRGVQFTPIGFIENPGDYPASVIYSMNPAGTVFMATPTPYGNYCVKWTKEGGWGEQVGNAGSVCFLADDGTVAGDGVVDEGYWPSYWTGTLQEWDPVPAPDGLIPCGSSVISTHGASDNLDHLVGLGWGENCRGRRWHYDSTTGESVQLDCMTDDSCRLNDVTNDASKMVGWNTSLCGAWRGTKTEGDNYDWIDGLGDLQRKVCTSGGPCCGNSDCPEFVDAYCDEQCIDGFCGAGPNEGMECTSDWQCDGYCVNGANDGLECTSDYYCPDDPACVDNPDWDPLAIEGYKGEGYKVSPDGKYTLGFEYGQSPYHWSDPLYDWTLFSSAYIENPDGSFTQIPPPPGGLEGDSWTPLAISDKGDVVVGRYGWWIYSYPVMWTKYTGTIDFQYFLVSQGLDELWFWYLSSLNAVSGDGRTVAGYGDNAVNPDCPLQFGCTEGYVVDFQKVSVCHKPGAHERTLTIAMESVGDHLGHGDFLGTCEFMNSGGRSRAADLHRTRPTETLDAAPPAAADPMIRSKADVDGQAQQWTPVQSTGTKSTTSVEHVDGPGMGRR